MAERQKGHQACKNWVLVCWLWRFDWSIACLVAPVVTTIYSLSSLVPTKSRMETFLVTANPGRPGKWLLK